MSLAGGFDPLSQMRSMLGARPWDSIVDFATHPSFCGKRLYPRQLTLLKLIYLETENMTAYDLDVIEQWRLGFKSRVDTFGVQPDIWDRVEYLKSHGYHHFPHILSVMGRRASKGITGGILGAERLANMYALNNWQDYFGLDPGMTGELMVIATSQAQAAKRQFADIRRTVENCEYLKRAIVGNKYTEFYIQTPNDLLQIDEMKSQGVALDREYATIYATASSSVSTSQRGGSSFFNAYDEMAHMLMGTGSTKSGEEIYAAYQPSLDQFGIERMTYVASSPYTKIGMFFELYKQGSVTMDVYNEREGQMETRTVTEADLGVDVEEELDAISAEPEMLIAQMPSWALYEDWNKSTTIPMMPSGSRTFRKFKRPVQFSPQGDKPENKAMARMRQRNPEKFKVERGGQFASVIDAYLDEAMVDRMFEPLPWREPLREQDSGSFVYAYRAHGDPGRTNANFAFSIAHTEMAPCDACGYHGPLTQYTLGKANEHIKCPAIHDGGGGHIWPHVIIDKLKVWRPQDFPDGTIDYVQVSTEIDAYCKAWLSLKKLSFDQWNSAHFLSSLKRKYGNRMRIVQQTFTQAENDDRNEKFKSALNLGWVSSYRDTFFDEGQSLLETELKFLQEKNGKIIKQEFGPCTTKDLADCVQVVTVDLLHEALDRHAKLNEATAVYGSANPAALKSGRAFEQMAATGLMPEQQSARVMERAQQNRSRLQEMRDNSQRNRRVGGPMRTRGRTL
ncbi:terminase [Gordonia phage Skog]|uniref:Terminase n=1 Tax=Gordonia phage Skog TaxID=2704033 RepID=A0A6G6XJ88_9CAUD|nr:terminase [Gordonia phage Skog]QIG58158.1 terminase [Gordonia phage Skog]